MFKRLVQLTVILTVVAVVTAVGISMKQKKNANDPYKEFALFAKVYNIVKAQYVEPVDDAHLMEGAYRGAVESIFNQNSYIPADTMAKLQPRLTEKARVGIRVMKRGGYAQVVHVDPGSEAAKKGIEEGTIIQQINGTYTWDMSLFAIKAMLQGPENGPVTLTYYSMDQSKDIKEEFHYQLLDTPAFSIRDVDGISAFRVESFTDDIVESFSKYEAKDKPLVLDLRYTQGGQYKNMMKLAGAILGRNVKVSVKRRDSEDELQETAAGVKFKRPLFVLTSSFTMNAGDVLANLLKGHTGITIIGSRTSGKAFQSELFQLDNGTYVEMATVFYGPVTDKGMMPDVRSYIDDAEVAAKIRSLMKAKESDSSDGKAAA